MTNLIVTVIIAAVVGLAGFYIRKEKKKGARCIGCPDSGTCSGHCAGCAGCGGCGGKQ